MPIHTQIRVPCKAARALGSHINRPNGSSKNYEWLLHIFCAVSCFSPWGVPPEKSGSGAIRGCRVPGMPLAWSSLTRVLFNLDVLAPLVVRFSRQKIGDNNACTITQVARFRKQRMAVG